jgi:bacteriorhodopsin
MAILHPRNNALNVNPPSGDQFLTTNGSNWLYTVTAIFGLSLLALIALQFRARAGERFFHYLFIIANFAGLLAYYAMASDLAWVPIRQANQIARSGLLRQIFWAKYVFWVVEFPIVLIALGVLSGIAWATIAFHVALSWTWVLAYLVAALTPTKYKWGFFAFGLVAQIYLAVSTLRDGMTSANRVGIRRDYSALAGWVNLLWLLYPIAWALSDGGNYIGVTASFIWFGILDILLLTVVGFAFVFLSRRWDYGRLNIAFTQYGRVPAAQGTFPEKQAQGVAPAPDPAATPVGPAAV